MWDENGAGWPSLTFEEFDFPRFREEGCHDNMGRLIGTTTQYTFLPGHNLPERLQLRRGGEPHRLDRARWINEHVRLRHAEPADDVDQLTDRPVRLRLRCAEPEDAADAAEWHQHQLQLRFRVAPAERAAPGGLDDARRGQLRLRLRWQPDE